MPFYTNKKQGSGIGLVLCQQILEAHDGKLTLTNKAYRPAPLLLRLSALK